MKRLWILKISNEFIEQADFNNFSLIISQIYEASRNEIGIVLM